MGSFLLEGKRLIGWAVVLSLGKCSVSVVCFVVLWAESRATYKKAFSH